MESGLPANTSWQRFVRNLVQNVWFPVLLVIMFIFHEIKNRLEK
jgi:hypothetical protein